MGYFVVTNGLFFWVIGIIIIAIARKRRFLIYWAVSGPFVLFILWSAAPYLFFDLPDQLDRREQRKQVASRVANAGGWSALESEFNRLIRQMPGGGEVGDLTQYPVLAHLKARKVTLWPLEPEGHYLVIYLFGSHSTGGRGVPHYDLVLTSPPTKSVLDLPGYYLRRNVRNITNNVYEVFGPG